MLHPSAILPGARNWVDVADVDADGDADLLYTESGQTYCLINDGGGGFAAPIVAGEVMGGQKFANINGDIYPDMVGTGQYSCGKVPTFMIGNGDGTFGPEIQGWVTQGYTLASTAVAADFSSDGYGDIAFGALDKYDVTVGINDGRNVFRTFSDLAEVDTGVTCMATGDFDGDGDPDLAAAGLDDSLTIFFSLGGQHSSRILVPDDVPTIQGAIEDAWNLDTIVVQPGIFTENIDFGGKNLVLMSAEYESKGSISLTALDADSATATIIDGGGVDRVFTFDDFEDNRSVVAGFIIQNGNATGLGGGIYFYDTAAATITHNIIRNNYASSWAGAIFAYSGDVVIDHNYIIGNSSGFMAGAMYVYGPTVITNNTVYGNSTDQGGGGFYIGFGSPTLCNNIFWGNSSNQGDQELGPSTATINITYSVIQGGWPGVGNIDEDPMFVDPDNGDFRLLIGSPCIDAGDPNAPLDPDGTTADIGAVCYQTPTAINDPDFPELPGEFALSQNYPNPFNASTTIRFSLSRRSEVVINIYDVLGRCVTTLRPGVLPAGEHQALWQADAFASGVYFYRLRAGANVDTRKMILLK
jgi:hypothetical protein